MKIPKWLRKKSQEEQEQFQKNRNEEDRRRKLVKEHLYPLIVSSSKSVYDAKLFCSVIVAGIRQKFNKNLGTMKIRELNLEDDVKHNLENDKYRTLIAFLKDEPIAVALDILEGFNREVEYAEQEEAKQRPITDLDIKIGNEYVNK